MATLSIRDQAPEFNLLDETETARSLGEFTGSYVVLYFYPKDDTPGCTKEACAIRDSFDEFQKQGIVVLGVSKDSPASHVKFKQKYDLPFTLLSDPEQQTIKAYGANGGFMTRRITFIIDPEGTIAHIYPKVDPASHAIQIIRDIQNLQK